MTELAQRTIVAVIAAPLAIATVYVGGLPLAVLLSLLAAGCAWELFRMARIGSTSAGGEFRSADAGGASGVSPLDALGVPMAGALPLLVYAWVDLRLATPVTLAMLAVLLILAACIFVRGPARQPLAAASITVFGIIYTGGALSFGYLLRAHPYAVGPVAGTLVVLLPLLVTWSTDIGAYAVGSIVGGRKLIPSVSPGKTVSGAVGGVVLAAIVGWLVMRFGLLPHAQLAMTTRDVIAFAVIVSVVAQVGDLAESLIKRDAGVKDSSRLIPGHGGLLDRLDSLLFVLPVSWLLLGRLLMAVPR